MIEFQFQYKPFFSVKLVNKYFNDQILKGFKIEPTRTTEALIDRLGFIFKSTDTGLNVLADNSNTEKLMMRLDMLKGTKAKLEFKLYIKDPIFKNYTNIPFDTNSKAFVFSNRNLGTSLKAKMHKQEHVSAEDLYKVNQDKSIDELEGIMFPTDMNGTPIGLIELVLSDQIIEQFNSKLMDNELIGYDYSIEFDSRAVFWRYIIIPGYTKKLKGLNIVGQNTDKAIGFQKPEETTYRGKEVLTIETKQPMKYKEMYDFTFQLKRGEGGNGGKTLIKKMQFAPIDFIIPYNKGKEKDEAYCSEIYVYI